MIKKLLITSVLAGCMSVGWASCEERVKKLEKDIKNYLHNPAKGDNPLHVYQSDQYLLYLEPVKQSRCNEQGHISIMFDGYFIGGCVEWNKESKGPIYVGDVSLEIKKDDSDIPISLAFAIDHPNKENFKIGRACGVNGFDEASGAMYLSMDLEGKPVRDIESMWKDEDK